MDPKVSNPSPAVVQETIDRVIKKMRYRKKVRAEVRAELEAHFEDALAACQTLQEQQRLAEQMIADFGDPQLLARLIRRAKKRCRPTWVKVMMRAGQVMGLLVLYFLVCVSRLYIGRPTIKVDTVAKLNRDLQQDRNEDLNALPGIEGVLDLMTPQSIDLWPSRRRYPDMNDMEQHRVDVYLAENQKALDELQLAVQKPYFWRQYAPVSFGKERTGTGYVFVRGLMNNTELAHRLVEQVMPELPRYRELAFALRGRAYAYGTQGQVGPALADAMTAIRLGTHITGQGLLVEQLVGVAISAVGNEVLWRLLADMEVDEPLLAETYAALEALSAWDRPWLDFTAEKAMVDDLIQRGFTDDGEGNGRPLASGVFLLGGSPAGWWKNLLLWNYPDRRQAQEHIHYFFQDLQLWQTIMPWDRQDQGYQLSHQAMSTLYVTMMKPALERTGELAWRNKLGFQVSLTLLAIKRYQARHGVLPERLEVLVTDDFMKTVPRDFYAPGSLSYQRRSDRDFVLYSRGEDLQDDMGVPSTNDSGAPQKYGSQGDWIFWPVQR